MKYAILCLTLLTCPMLMCPPAHASNAALEEALKGRSELSGFYKAMQESGVLAELQEGKAYTVFAPNDAAMSTQSRREYPCFDVEKCKEETAAIIRNHIVPQVEHIGQGGKSRGGLYSINQRFIAMGEPSRNVYTVDGQRILRSTYFRSGMLYTIDGVIINQIGLMNYGKEERTTTVTRKTTIPDPACGPQGCPDSYTETTVITRQVPED